MGKLAASAIFEGVGGIELNPAPDGYVIYQTAKERVHFLNPTAAIVYELCLSGKSVGEIETIVQEAFGLGEKPAVAVQDCLESLLAEQLIKPCPSSSSAP